MPELPEVEVLRRHLDPVLSGRIVRSVEVRRPRVIRPTPVAELTAALVGARFRSVGRRGKYLVFDLERGGGAGVRLYGHLGMTGRMYVQPAALELPRHTSVVIGLDGGNEVFLFEDPRYFGRFNLDPTPLGGLGPEPLGADFTIAGLAMVLRRSARPIKVVLMDQTVVAGVGNIYASEALFRAGVSPRKAARRLRSVEVGRVRESVREILTEAILCGSTLPLDFGGGRDGLFYYGAVAAASELGGSEFYTERLRVYDRAGEPCERCGTAIRRIVQATRSTFYCAQCQK